MMGIGTSVAWELSQEIIDPAGRFLILKRKLNPHNVTLGGLYASNQIQVTFWEALIGEVAASSGNEVVVFGDFNTVIHKEWDRSHHSTTTPNLPKRFHRFKSAFDLIDVWWVKNLSTRDYSFFSHRHQTYSRIDVILFFSVMIPDILDPVI